MGLKPARISLRGMCSLNWMQETTSLPSRQRSIYSRLDNDVMDVERRSVDPATRHVAGGKAALTDKQVAFTREVGRFETEILSFFRLLPILWTSGPNQRVPTPFLPNC